jgi:putative nucleotidyltransferase with HDIG domain
MKTKIATKQFYKLIGILKKTFINYTEAGGGKGYRFSHCLRVMYYCRNFLKSSFFRKLKLDSVATLIAALFHDIGKIEAATSKKEIRYNSYSNKYHEEIGALIVGSLLKKALKDITLQTKVSEIINDLSKEKPRLLEARLIKDADSLDNYGVIKIWRTIIYAQYQNRQVERVYQYWEEEGRKKAKKEISNFYFKPIKLLAIKRFKKLDRLIKEIKIENLALDVK